MPPKGARGGKAKEPVPKRQAVILSDSDDDDAACASVSPAKKRLLQATKVAKASRKIAIDDSDDSDGFDDGPSQTKIADLLNKHEKDKVNLRAKIVAIETDRDTYGLAEATSLLVLTDESGSCVLAEVHDKALTSATAGDSVIIVAAWWYPVEQRIRILKDSSMGLSQEKVKATAAAQKETIASLWSAHFNTRFRTIATLKQMDDKEHYGEHFNIRATIIQVCEKQSWHKPQASPIDLRSLLLRDDRGDSIQVTFWRSDAQRKPPVGYVAEISGLRMKRFKGEICLNSFEGMTQLKLVGKAAADVDLTVPTRFARQTNIVKIRSVERSGLVIYAACAHDRCYFAKLKSDKAKPYCGKCLRLYDQYQGAKQGVKIDATCVITTDVGGKELRKLKLFTSSVGKLLGDSLAEFDASIDANDMFAAVSATMPVRVTGTLEGDGSILSVIAVSG